MENNNLLLFIVIIIDVIIIYLIYNFYNKLVLFDKLFLIFCLIAHMFIYISFYCEETICKKLRYSSDNMLFISMGLSIFLKNKFILFICILTMLTIGILKLYKKYCILTEKDWDNTTYMLYFPILLLQLIRLIS